MFLFECFSSSFHLRKGALFWGVFCAHFGHLRVFFVGFWNVFVLGYVMFLFNTFNEKNLFFFLGGGEEGEMFFVFFPKMFLILFCVLAASLMEELVESPMISESGGLCPNKTYRKRLIHLTRPCFQVTRAI